MSHEKITALIAEARTPQHTITLCGLSPADASPLVRRLADALEASVPSPAVDREALVALALNQSDDENHAQLCHCAPWPESCVTYGENRPWSHNGERLIEIALDSLFASGILQDAAEVWDEGSQAAWGDDSRMAQADEEGKERPPWTPNPYRAQQVREGENDDC